MKSFRIISITFALAILCRWASATPIKGRVADASTGEAIIGASVIYNNKEGEETNTGIRPMVEALRGITFDAIYGNHLTMADPYDTTDGQRDGITQVGLVQFFYDWFCVMTPEPWQQQPYIVVEPATGHKINPLGT